MVTLEVDLVAMDFGAAPFLVKYDRNPKFWFTIFRKTVKLLTGITITFPIQEWYV